jgi:hypothetical protein
MNEVNKLDQRQTDGGIVIELARWGKRDYD